MSETMIEENARNMGLPIHIVAGGDIYVKSGVGHWRITQRRDGKWKLMHENYRYGGSVQRGTYHAHETVYPDPVNALEYIMIHDHVRNRNRAMRSCA